MRISIHTAPVLFLAALLLPAPPEGSSPLAAQEAGACPDPQSLISGMEGPLAHVRYLADDALEGRDTGSPGARCAADYIASHFRKLGLEGGGPDGSFFQEFEVRLGSVFGAENDLRIDGREMGFQTEWVPFGFSASGSARGALVYGGPGVSMPGSEMDRYAHMDIQGKVVVVEGASPQGSGGMAADPHLKASVAAGRGAAAVLILLEAGQVLPDPVSEERPPVRIPALALSGAMADAVRTAAEAGEEATLTAAVDPRMVKVRNVVAMIPGTDSSQGDQAIVLGAHYDHLGYGGTGSLAPDSRAIHNGADDNASGTAALMEVAERLVGRDAPPARSVIFVAFTGEERGLWGSIHYARDPLISLDRTLAMVNMDMVGRLRENTLTVYGTGTAQEFPELLEEVNQAQAQPFVLASIPDGFGPSDHNSFYGEAVPVLMLFTNTHGEYHRPEDDWHLINGPGLERVASFASGLAGRLAGTPGEEVVALTYQAGAGNPHGAMAQAAEEGESSGRPSRGYGPYFGSIPDMTPRDHGVRVTGVRSGSPAEKAGLEGGDVIVEFGGKEITDLYAYTYALREYKPGDSVTVVVLRGEERLTLEATLGERGG